MNKNQIDQEKVEDFINRLNTQLFIFRYDTKYLFQNNREQLRKIILGHIRYKAIDFNNIDTFVMYKLIRAYDYLLQTYNPQNIFKDQLQNNNSFYQLYAFLLLDIFDKLTNNKILFIKIPKAFNVDFLKTKSLECQMVSNLYEVIGSYYATDMIQQFIDQDFTTNQSSQLYDLIEYQYQSNDQLQQIMGSPIIDQQANKKDQLDIFLKFCYNNAINIIMLNPEFTEKEIFYGILFYSAKKYITIGEQYYKVLKFMYQLQNDDQNFSKINVQNIIQLLQQIHQQQDQ